MCFFLFLFLEIYCEAPQIMVNLFMGSITPKVWEPLI